MNGKKRITKILAMIICLIFCTNQVAVYGAELVLFSDGVEEQGEISSAGIEEMDSSETEEEVSADNSPGDSEGTEISEEDFLDNSTEKNQKIIDGLPCQLPETVLDDKDNIMVVVALRNCQSALEQLQKLGFTNIIIRQEIDGILTDRSRKQVKV